MISTSLSALISILGAVISAIAAAVSVASYRLRRRADQRAELKERREDPSLSVYLHDAETEVVGDDRCRVWRFLLTVTNESDRENSVVQAECRVSYRTAGEHVYNVSIPVYADHGDAVVSTDKLGVPLRLDGRQAIEGVLTFGAPDTVLAGGDIVGYRIILKDAYGKTYQTEALVVLEQPGEHQETRPEAKDPRD